MYVSEEIAKKIIEDCIEIKSKDPIAIFNFMCNKDYIPMHGPEHHVLDGACLLTAFYNAGGQIDIKKMLEKIMAEGMMMPIGTCGRWGVCGAVTSVGAALSLLDRNRQEAPAKLWGDRMNPTSNAVLRMSEIGGPRCCKRNGYIALTEAIRYINANFEIQLPEHDIKCGFSSRNPQCLGEKCPYNIH